MQGITQDILYEEIDNYDENIVTTSADMKMVTNRKALFQGLRGEIKTKKGECKGTGMGDYGCDIWKIFGENLTQLIVDQANLYIKELEPKYEEINELTITDLVEQKKGRLVMTLHVDSIYGKFTEDIIIDF